MYVLAGGWELCWEFGNISMLTEVRITACRRRKFIYKMAPFNDLLKDGIFNLQRVFSVKNTHWRH